MYFALPFEGSCCRNESRLRSEESSNDTSNEGSTADESRGGTLEFEGETNVVLGVGVTIQRKNDAHVHGVSSVVPETSIGVDSSVLLLLSEHVVVNLVGRSIGRVGEFMSPAATSTVV